MSENDEMVSVVDDGRPGATSRSGDSLIDDNMPPINRTNSQNSVDDISSTDTPTQIEKLATAGGGILSGRRSISSSSPIIIPKKPSRSNASSQSSSSYTSVIDPASSFNESDDVPIALLPILSVTCQQLEHSAARDRISVKNKRRQPIKQKLSTLRETEDNELDLFSSKTEVISSTPEEDQPIRTEINKIPQPLIDLSDLDSARARLRMSARPRDRSADNILLATNTINETTTTTNIPAEMSPKFNNHMQRSVSFKRPQDLTGTKSFNPTILKTKKKETDEQENESINTSSPTQSISRSSSQEHIYDNLDVFKRAKPIINEDEIVKTREHPLPTPRLRPLTMHIPPTSSNDKQTTNEFENVFNQLKKRGSIRRVRPSTEEPPPVEETPPPPPPPPHENEPIIKPIETISNRRKTVGGVHLPTTNKVATNDNKPTPSWIDIAKQKHNKFQLVSNEKNPQDEPEHETPAEPLVMVRKQSSSVDNRSNRKSMFEQSTTVTNTNPVERDSIRAFKAGNPNRINNLIQFFDK